MTSNQGTDADFYTYQSAEDAEMVGWVDAKLTEAETNGTLTEVSHNLAGDMALGADDIANAFEQVDPANAPEVPAVPPTREEIRERIFARLRRPDGTPYAAGYTQGPAARKPQYEGEDQRSGDWRIPNDPDGNQIVTQYADRDTLGARATTTSAQGQVLDANGAPISGSWGWVIDEQTGYLMLFDPRGGEATSPEGVTGPLAGLGGLRQLLNAGYTIRATHHTTPVAGMPVVGAGMMTLDQGVITQVTDESGHYRPDAVQEWNALQALIASGVDVASARVRLTGREMDGNRPTDKAGWIDEAHQRDPNFPTGDVTLTSDQFRQTGGDEYQIRLKQAVNEQIRGQGQTPPAAEGVGTGGAANDAFYPDDQAANYPDDQANYIDDDQPAHYVDDDAVADPNAQWLADARTYLSTQGRAAFTTWFGTLPRENQDMLTADPEIAAGLNAAPAPAPAAPAAPTDDDQQAIGSANAAAVGALSDGQATPFTVAGFTLLIGGGHDQAHIGYVQGAADSVSGSVTMRTSAFGLGSGTLSFRGVPPAKQDIVRAAVARFSRATVEFA